MTAARKNRVPKTHDKSRGRAHHLAGLDVAVELATRESERTIEADLTRERVKDLALEKGQGVYIRPTSLRTFEANAAE